MDQLSIDELQAVGLYPSTPSPVRIERFIEQRFKLSPIYEDLPSDVMGYTRFGQDGVQAIIVSRALSEEGTRVSEYRLNTTLAHEAGHGLLHTYLFVLSAQNMALFNNDDVDPTKILCRKQGILDRRQKGHTTVDGGNIRQTSACLPSFYLTPWLLNACGRLLGLRE